MHRKTLDPSATEGGGVGSIHSSDGELPAAVVHFLSGNSGNGITRFVGEEYEKLWEKRLHELYQPKDQ
jgi:hypothetical protein